ncbi:hypothetical protein F7725_012929 [Dissostichus mawsoni]|uniref:Uncharacterized protein n=1 Tax=Dissostichus mawsoni TaxID=36200 RepID=A0A7J5YRW6_DISMA|nr:hypothetical protein F7725_012929 [Dissostichus mawsoni]
MLTLAKFSEKEIICGEETVREKKRSEEVSGKLEKDDAAKHKCPQREESQVNWRSYQWCSLYVCKVLQQALSVVDGGVELKVGILPLAIQILSTQRTTMTTAEEGKDRE